MAEKNFHFVRKSYNQKDISINKSLGPKFLFLHKEDMHTKIKRYLEWFSCDFLSEDPKSIFHKIETFG